MIGFKKNVGLILGFGGVILFGGTLPATRLTVAAIDPLLLTAARACIAGITGLAVLLALRRPQCGLCQSQEVP
jgi:drug/metabolite transporter (DMT)-like permease